MELLKISQVIVAILLIIAILLQNKGAGLSGVFGGGGGDVYMAKRGFEKKLFNFTIMLSIIFLGLSLYIVF